MTTHSQDHREFELRKPRWDLNRRWSLLIATAVFFQFSVTSAMANAGTPLMWAGMLHLIFGNLFIGIGEGLVLAWVFRLNKPVAMLVMVAANYVSAWIVLVWLNGRITQALDLELYNAWRWIWIMAGMSFVITLLLEWPFVAFCLARKPGWFRRSLLGSILVQSISYSLLLPWYWGASGKSLYTQGHIVQLADLDLPPGLTMYFIGKEDGDIHRFDFHNRTTDWLLGVNSTNREDRLAVLPAQTNAISYRVVARLEIDDESPCTNRMILDGLTTEQVAIESARSEEPESTWFNFGSVPRIGDTTDRETDFYVGFWPVEGLARIDDIQQAHLKIAFETPFVAWSVRNATQLPSDHVVFQLGDDQICILEPESRKVARIVFGRGPVVVKTRSTSGMPDDTLTVP